MHLCIGSIGLDPVICELRNNFTKGLKEINFFIKFQWGKITRLEIEGLQV